MKIKKITVAVISAALAMTVMLCFAPSIAKYITTQGMQSEIDSDHFYFSSNYLRSDDTPVYEIFGSSITFELRNYVDSLRINETDITYTATSTDGTISSPTGTLTAGALRSSTVTLSYSFSGDEQQKDITVSVTGTGDYTETLQAKFIFIKPTSNLKYEIKDSVGSNYAVLYLYTGDADMTAELSWHTDKLLIDETNDYVFGRVTNDLALHTGTATIQNIVAGTTAKIVFFKKNLSEDYTCGITVSDDRTVNLP